jgi:antitoxin (DNA-binding transcriptional repressor) of toxin-antitoxin stability system
MKAVGIKNLKNSLSKYLDMVREGEVIYVTDRDDIIAEIHKPVSAPTRLISHWEAFLNEEERKGSIPALCWLFSCSSRVEKKPVNCGIWWMARSHPCCWMQSARSACGAMHFVFRASKVKSG